MQLFSAGIRKTSGCNQLKSVFCLLCFSIVVSLGGVVKAEKLDTVVKVCLKDDAGQIVTDQPKIILSNAPSDAKVNSQSPDNNGCYSSGQIKLDTNKTYIVAALKGDKTDAAVLKLSPGQLQTVVNLTLSNPGAPPPQTGIKLCAQDENQKPVPIKDIALLDSNEIIYKSPGDNGVCPEFQLAAARAYHFKVSMTSAPGSSGLSNFSLLPLLAILLFTLGLFLTVWRMSKSRAVHPEVTSNEAVYEIVESMSDDVAYIKDRVDELTQRDVSPEGSENAPAQSRSESTEAVDINAADVIEEEPVNSQGETGESQSTTSSLVLNPSLRQMAEARQKYCDFIAGSQVEHFSLMPLGDSSASRMDADAQVKLREQDYGTYIAFCSSDGADEAWVFPRPRLHFTPQNFSAVFPFLTEQDYQSGLIEPRRAVKSMEPKLWKIE